MEGKVTGEFVHQIENFPQPHPEKNKGGDCFSCALTAALRWLYPEKNLTFEEVEKSFWLEKENGEDFWLGNSWGVYPRVFDNAIKLLGLSGFKYKHHFVAPDFSRPHFNYAWNRSHGQYIDYWEELKKEIKDGGVIYTSINMGGSGPMTPDGKQNHTDHIVLYDGIRERTVPIEGIDWASRIYQEIHVVCSAKGNYWKDTHDLLNMHGAGAWYILKRDTEGV